MSDKKDHLQGYIQLKQDQWNEVTFTIPDTCGDLIDEVRRGSQVPRKTGNDTGNSTARTSLHAGVHGFLRRRELRQIAENEQAVLAFDGPKGVARPLVFGGAYG